MGLRAQSPEQCSVPGDDVVRIETVESRSFRAPDERRVAEDASDAPERYQRLRPGDGRIAIRVVDEEVGEPTLLLEACDVLRRPRRRPIVVRLYVNCDRQTVLARRVDDELKPRVFR